MLVDKVFLLVTSNGTAVAAPSFGKRHTRNILEAMHFATKEAAEASAGPADTVWALPVWTKGAQAAARPLPSMRARPVERIWFALYDVEEKLFRKESDEQWDWTDDWTLSRQYRTPDEAAHDGTVAEKVVVVVHADSWYPLRWSHAAEEHRAKWPSAASDKGDHVSPDLWVIRAPGPHYLTVEKGQPGFFWWREDLERALRFRSAEEADLVMEAVKANHKELFGFAVTLGDAVVTPLEKEGG